MTRHDMRRGKKKKDPMCVHYKSWYGEERERGVNRNSQKVEYLNEKVILMPIQPAE